MLMTEKGAPEGRVGIRLERMSGQVPLPLFIAPAPSVIELPKQMATLLDGGAETCTSETISTWVVELFHPATGS